MNEQPTALWLADELEDACAPKFIVNEAAAELRRQHKRTTTLEAALRQALEALERLLADADVLDAAEVGALKQARAAVAKIIEAQHDTRAEGQPVQLREKKA